MDATVYQIISIVGFGLAALFLVIAIILFFAFDVVALYGEVSGKTADKQVKELRENNKRVSGRRREPEKSGSLEKSSKQIAKGIFGSNVVVTGPDTQKVQASIEEQTDVLKQTTVLNEETTVLEEETTVLNEETTVLEEETTVLSENAMDDSHSEELIMLEDDIEIHTDETI